MHQGPVRGIAEDDGPVSELDRDHLRRLRADQSRPRSRSLVGLSVVNSGWTPGRDPHALVRFVHELKRLDARDDRMWPCRGHDIGWSFLTVDDGNVTLALQPVAAADHVLGTTSPSSGN